MKRLCWALLFSYVFMASNVFAEEKTPIDDHQTCVAEWVKESKDAAEYYGKYKGEKTVRRSLEKQVESLSNLLESAMTKILIKGGNSSKISMSQGASKNAGFPTLIEYVRLRGLNLLEEQHKSKLKCLERKWSNAPVALQQAMAMIPEDGINKKVVKRLFKTKVGEEVAEHLDSCLD